MKKILLTLFSLLSIVLYAKEEPVVLELDGVTLHGALRVPDADTKMPVALIIAGSGPTDRDGNNPLMINNSLKMLAEGLNANGIATLNYDKRAIAESAIPDLKEEDLSFEDYINDAKALVDLLDKDPRFSEIIVIGHSEGSLIGMVTALNNPKVDAFVSVAGAAVPIDEILKKQMSEQAPELLEMATPMIEQLKRGELITDEINPMLMSLFRPSVQPYIISWFRYNPVEIIGELTIPVLIINGTTDIQVYVDQAELLKAAKPDAELIIIEKMNHVLKEAESMDMAVQQPLYISPDIPLSDALVTAIVNWLHYLPPTPSQGGGAKLCNAVRTNDYSPPTKNEYSPSLGGGRGEV